MWAENKGKRKEGGKGTKKKEPEVTNITKHTYFYQRKSNKFIHQLFIIFGDY